MIAAWRNRPKAALRKGCVMTITRVQKLFAL